MQDHQERRPLRVARGLLRLWVVGATLWVCAVAFAFWLGNGGVGAHWVWRASPAAGNAIIAPTLTPPSFPSVAAGAAQIAAMQAAKDTAPPSSQPLTYEQFSGSGKAPTPAVQAPGTLPKPPPSAASAPGELPWDAVMAPQPAPAGDTFSLADSFTQHSTSPVIVLQQLPGFLVLSLLPPVFVLVLGASLAWAVRGFGRA